LSAKETSVFFSSITPHLIIHCAAFVPSSLHEYHDSSLSKNNTLLLRNVMDASTCPIMYISSMTVYGSSLKVIRRECEPSNPESEYGRSKLLGETTLQEHQRDSLAIRIPGLFGGSRKNGLIYNNISQLNQGITPSLPTEPLLWAAMNVEDAANSIVKIAKKHSFSGFEVINIGYQDCYSLNALVNIYRELFNYPIQYTIEHPVFQFDLTKLKKIGAMPNIGLFSAIKKYKGQIC
jgi:nucleoside-diphosphate-sugar epimerase